MWEFLFNIAWGLMGVKSTFWGIYAVGLVIAGIASTRLKLDRIPEGHRLLVRCEMAALILLVAHGTATAQSEYARTPSGMFYAASNFAARHEVDITRVPTTSVSLGGVTVKIGDSKRTHAGVRVFLEFSMGGISLTGHSLTLVEDCWSQLKSPFGEVYAVVLDDRADSTILGLLWRPSKKISDTHLRNDVCPQLEDGVGDGRSPVPEPW